MKRIIKGLAIVILTGLSFYVLADRIVITGKPAQLEVHDGYFTLPPGFTPPTITNYHYVTFTGTDRVCYMDRQPQLSSLDTVQIYIEEYGKKIRWNCYQFDPRFFEVDF
jgi:hypothetical protein